MVEFLLPKAIKIERLLSSSWTIDRRCDCYGDHL